MAIPFAGVNTGKLLVTGMRVAAENHRIIANNIANADTPHFTPTRMDFQKTLRREVEGRSHVDLRTTQARHLDYRSYRPVLAKHAQSAKNDYNKVDLDAEVAKLGENRGNYTTYSALLTKRYRMYKNMLDDLR
ncbi:MAG: flagellar basal body rod protein FlgB [Candidatus Hydrogenedentota bacterium]